MRSRFGRWACGVALLLLLGLLSLVLAVRRGNAPERGTSAVRKHASVATSTTAATEPTPGTRKPSKVSDIVERTAAEIAAAVTAGRSAAAVSNAAVRTTDDGAIEVAIWGVGPVGDREKAALARFGVVIESSVAEPRQGGHPGVGLVQGLVPYHRIDDVAALSWVAAITPVEPGELDRLSPGG